MTSSAIPISPKHHRRHSPAEGIVERTAQPRSQRGARRRTERIKRHRQGPRSRREIIGRQRLCRQCAARFTNAHRDPGDQQLSEGAGQAAQRREQRPRRQRHPDRACPAGAIGEDAERDARSDIEPSQSGTRQQPDRSISECEFVLDRFDQGGDNEAISDVQGIDAGQQDEHVPAARSIPATRR